MPLMYQWLIPGRVIHQKLVGQITPEDIAKIDAGVLPWHDAATVPLIHHLIDATELVAMPNVTQLSRTQYVRHPKMGWYVAGGVDSPLFTMLGTVMGHAVKLRVKLTEDMPSAITFLQSRVPDLPDLHAAYAQLERQRD